MGIRNQCKGNTLTVLGSSWPPVFLHPPKRGLLCYSGVFLGGKFYGAPGGLNNLDAKCQKVLVRCFYPECTHQITSSLRLNAQESGDLTGKFLPLQYLQRWVERGLIAELDPRRGKHPHLEKFKTRQMASDIHIWSIELAWEWDMGLKAQRYRTKRHPMSLRLMERRDKSDHIMAGEWD